MSRTGSLPQRHIADQLDRMADELSDRFRGVFSSNTVTRFVYETYAMLDEHATVKAHLVSLTARSPNNGSSTMDALRDSPT